MIANILRLVLKEIKKKDKGAAKGQRGPYHVRVGQEISVMYTVTSPGKMDIRKWYHGTVRRLGRCTSTYRTADIEFDGEVEKGFKLHYNLYRTRREAGWRLVF